jgi:hypothetical protein
MNATHLDRPNRGTPPAVPAPLPAASRRLTRRAPHRARRRGSDTAATWAASSPTPAGILR